MAMPQCCYLAKGAKRPSHTTNTIKFDLIPFDPCNSIKRFDLCPFDQKNSTYLQPPDYILNGTIKPFHLAVPFGRYLSFWPFLLGGTFPFGRSFWTDALLMGKHFPISVKLSNRCRLQLVATEASN